MNKSGIYYIECMVNNKKYVGSAQNLHGREVEHWKHLRNGTNNRYLQEDYNKHGEEKFRFVIVEELPNDDDLLLEKENYYMDHFKTYIHKYGHDYGYNNNKASRNRPTEESNKKRSESLKGKNISLTLEKCLEIKKLLLEETGELLKEKEARIAPMFNTSARTVGKIVRGDYWCSEQLGGKYKDWIGFDKKKLYLDILNALSGNDDKPGIDGQLAKKFNVSPNTVRRLRLKIITPK